MAKKVTMQNIADQLGISKNSVSQALTGKPGVSEETRARVVEMANKLGYRLSPGKTPEGRRTGNIGLIVSEFTFSENVFFGAINLSIQKEVELRKFALLIQVVDKASEDSGAMPPFLEEGKVDGVIVLSHLRTDYIQKIISFGVPVVMVDHHHPDLQADCVLTNNRFGAYDAVRHLIELGHEKIGFMGNVHVSPSYQERWEGYRLALLSSGMPIAGEYEFLSAKETEEDALACVRSLTDLPTAWFCTNDTMAFILSTVLAKNRYQVPDDVSVCGFDNIRLSELSHPSLTTVNINRELFGRRAVERLFWRMENSGAAFEELLLRTNLIVRESTRPRSAAPRTVRA
jgi:LacI family transcriptional regulator